MIEKDEILISKVALELKKLREMNNLTQEDVYNDTNIHIGRIESGKSNITVSTLYVLCKYFNITIQQFFCDIGL
ncbi:XRE family transcriptional regulator [Phocaeicola dorei]|uniref:XRE family transcriptional regulator n=1 Tax=Phocaeicola dorei TaxID=357276 RepID=A0A412ZHQ6_9BACT|nr:helix-turn-helix transcriptional regulator [Phocaeicola dorei]RGV80037.1 XRE family transcriptional regulator [Phocaeicola dorei]